MPSRIRKLPDPPPMFPPFPVWARAGRWRADREHIENAEFLAGAALAAIHPIARSDHPLGRLWRQRLALSNAEAAVKLMGRKEDSATLRDHLYLTRPGDDPGPAAKILMAWRMLATPIARTDAALLARAGELAKLLGLSSEAAVHQGLETTIDASGKSGPLIAVTEAIALSLKLAPDNRLLALWLADAALAPALNWSIPVPLLAAHLKRQDWRYMNGSTQQDSNLWRMSMANVLISIQK